ncbi:MAG: hypothetical protein EZS28_003884 [Streblomastix strix]|uniref:Uncharacterized protein n=1 Tax=Streblomastix strix TaxID=222440 RepID=A0A5J4X298_9EUKA|nr:MAG: hypothetical protein EZS28_003884 [Streblomastix strix]
MATQTDQDTILASQSSSTQGPDKESETPYTFDKCPVTKLDNFERLSGISDDDNASEHEIFDIEDDFMNSIELCVQFDPITGRIFILEQNKPVAEVKAQRFYSKSGRRLLGTQFQLTTFNEERAWLASINSDVEKMRMQLIQSSSSDHPIFRSQGINEETLIMPKMTPRKRVRADENETIQQNSEISPNVTQTVAEQRTPVIIRSIADEFEEQRNKYAKFQSKEEEIATRKLLQLLEGIMNCEAKSFDPLAFDMNPMERQILYQETQWKLANRMWKLLKVAPSAFGERTVFRIAIESSAQVQQVFLDIMHMASKGQLQGLMDKLVKGYKLSLLATGDAQRVREQLVGGIQTRSEKVEIFSETQKQRQSEIKKLKKEGFQESRFSNQRMSQLELGNYKSNQSNRSPFLNSNNSYQGKRQANQRKMTKGNVKGKRFFQKWGSNMMEKDKSDEEMDNKDPENHI